MPDNHRGLHHGRTQAAVPTTSARRPAHPCAKFHVVKTPASRVQIGPGLPASSGPLPASPIGHFFLAGDYTMQRYLARWRVRRAGGQAPAPRRSASPPARCGDRVTVLVASPTATPKSSLNLRSAYEACRGNGPVAKTFYLGTLLMAAGQTAGDLGHLTSGVAAPTS